MKLVEKIYSEPHILDSGNRREFGTGAVRDIQEGKGRCDLLPLDVVSKYVGGDQVLKYISDFQEYGNPDYLLEALGKFQRNQYCCVDVEDETPIIAGMFLDVSKHFEEGAKKYGEDNWRKGIPVHCYIDSAVRHYFKHLGKYTDEPHYRAFIWNILCAVWTCIHKPELNDYSDKDTNCSCTREELR